MGEFTVARRSQHHHHHQLTSRRRRPTCLTVSCPPATHSAPFTLHARPSSFSIVPYLRSPTTPWPWPSACSFAHPHPLPMFANHFFPCQQVNCFVLPFPAFITLCKLSDMSSTGARQSTHRANAKIMRFGIINEDKLAVAVLLSARARLHYSLNLPEKMT